MSVQVTQSQLASILRTAIQNKQRVLISGAPGVGKTGAVRTATSAAAHALITEYPSVAEPVNFSGYPMIVETGPEIVPFGKLRAVLGADQPTVFFLDDLGQGAQATQAAAMQLLDRLKDNPNVVVVAATNRRGDRAGVQGVLEPIKSRFDIILEVAVDTTSWLEWARNAGLHPMVIAYITVKPDHLHMFEPGADIVNHPCPRTWEFASRSLSAGYSDNEMLPVLCGSLGEGVGTSLDGFIRRAKQLPDMARLMADPEGTPLPDEMDMMYALCESVAFNATTENWPQIGKLIERIHGMDVDGAGAFAAALFIGCTRPNGNTEAERRSDKRYLTKVSLRATPTFTKLATGCMKDTILGAASI